MLQTQSVKTLGTNLVLKHATVEDAPRLNAFNAMIFDPYVGVQTEAMMLHHPTIRPENFIYIDDVREAFVLLVEAGFILAGQRGVIPLVISEAGENAGGGFSGVEIFMEHVGHPITPQPWPVEDQLDQKSNANGGGDIQAEDRDGRN